MAARNNGTVFDRNFAIVTNPELELLIGNIIPETFKTSRNIDWNKLSFHAKTNKYGEFRQYGDNYEVDVYFEPSSGTPSHEAEIEIELVNENGRIIKYKDIGYFDPESPEFNIEILMGTEKSETGGDPMKELLQTMGQLRITSARPIQKTDFSKPRNFDSEICLQVGSRKLYVDKFALMSVSPVFREMICNEKHGNKIEINDVKYDNLFTLLQFVHHYKNIITDENVTPLLYLANVYQIQFLIADCEEYLISSACMISKVDQFWIAENFELAKLQLHIMRDLTTMGYKLTEYGEV